jgi:hypothetical protein
MIERLALVALRHGVFALARAIRFRFLERAGLAPLVNRGVEGAWS